MDSVLIQARRVDCVHLRVHIRKALMAATPIVRVVVGVCSSSTATSGCRGFHSAASFHPRLLCVSAWVCGVARFGSPISTIARSFQTSIPVTQSSRGYRPSTPRRCVDVRVNTRADQPSWAGEVATPPNERCRCFCGLCVFPTKRFGACRTYTVGPSRKELPYGASSLRSGVRLHRGPEPATRISFPHPKMLYQVRLQYGCLTEGSSRDEAYTKAIRRLRESPESYISDVRQSGEPKKPRSLLRRLITGH